MSTEELVALVRTRDVRQVAEALDAGASPSGATKAGVTPVMIAAQYGEPEIVRLLIARGANVHARSASLQSPLSFAASSGAKDAALAEIVRLLVAAGAAIDTLHSDAPESELTPLHLAAYGLKPAVCKALLAAGAAVDARSSTGATPLHKACEDEYGTNTAEVLVAAGADVFIRDNEDRTPLDLALQHASERQRDRFRALLGEQ